MMQISYKDRSFIVEEMTEADKEILQAEKPELYSKFEKHFKEEKIIESIREDLLPFGITDLVDDLISRIYSME